MTPKQKNSIFIILLLAIAVYYIFSGGSVGVSLDFGEEALILSGLDYDWTIPYDRIVSLELAEIPELGTLVEGFQKRTLYCGIWENEAWGGYVLCINPKIDQCIVITMTDDTRYVINYENTESTKELEKMFASLLDSLRVREFPG